MKSMQKKCFRDVAVGCLVISLVLGGFHFLTVDSAAREQEKTTLQTACGEQAEKLNHSMELVEQSVRAVWNYAQRQLDSADRLRDADYRKSYTRTVRALALDVAGHTKGLLGVYLRYDPSIAGPAGGFFWARQSGRGDLQSFPATDLSKYDADDTEYVGWYYEPVQAGEAVWMSPYFNENIDVEMISYVIPFYQSGVLVGVIGMDMDFSYLVDLAQEGAVYESGHANLVDVEKKQIYYRRVGDDELTIRTDEITDRLYQDLQKEAAHRSGLLRYQRQDEETYQLTFRTVRNGMKYILCAPEKEMRSQEWKTLGCVAGITCAVGCLVLLWMLWRIRRTLAPLQQLDADVRRMAEGERDIVLIRETGDEVQSLAEHIGQLQMQLQACMTEINGLVYRDALTGVKNNMYYTEYIRALVQKEEKVPYAVVLFLVEMPEEMAVGGISPGSGVEGALLPGKLPEPKAGEIPLVVVCRIICRVFSHSPIFRIGEQQFAAILQGNDYAARESLIAQFAKEIAGEKTESDVCAGCVVSYGMAQAQEESTYAEVFGRAQQAMHAQQIR